MTGKRFVMYGNTVYEMKNDNKIELLPTDCFCLLNELNDENEQLTNELNTYKEANKTLKQTIDRILTDNIHFKTKLNELMKKEYKKNE